MKVTKLTGPTKPAVSITEILRALAIGDTVCFERANYGSLRTIASINGIRIRMRVLDDGRIEVTRKPDKSDKPAYDL